MFSVGTRVRLRAIGKGMWNQLGTIVDTISGQDGVARSFSVELDTGGGVHRHSTFLRLLDL